MAKDKLTEENYFSTENQLKYFGSSQIKAFMQCEAKAMAEIRGEYVPEPSTALLVGSFVDAYFESEDALARFQLTHPEIFTKSGGLRSDYVRAFQICSRIERDPMMMKYLGGQKQVIITEDLFGYPFKIKIDSYHPGKAIVDLKVMKDFEPMYVDGKGKVPFIEAWGYDIQGAIYQKVEQVAMGRPEPLPFVLAAVTKQPVPDIGLFQVPQYKLDAALKIVEANIDRFADIKSGGIDPYRCGRCEYCRETKVLDSVVVAYDE